MSDYDAARKRLERANEAHRTIRAAKVALERTQALIEAEWAAATRGLGQFEESPGIPLPQYREQVQA